MEQQRETTETSSESLRERIRALEVRHAMARAHDSDLTYRNLDALQLQINMLRHDMRVRGFGVPLGMAAWTKLGLAVLLPFLVLLLTGSLEKASTVSRLIGP